jgi:anti-sigma regulatory factor (Ser/Thr protein kinase)
MDTMSIEAAPDQSAVRIPGARESVRSFLEGLGPIADDAAGTVVPVVSELVTNAVRHGGAYTLGSIAHPDSIEVAVHDRSSQAPRIRTPDLNGGTGGFGWHMVDHLARTTTVTRHPSGGRAVSALLSR